MASPKIEWWPKMKGGTEKYVKSCEDLCERAAPDQEFAGYAFMYIHDGPHWSPTDEYEHITVWLKTEQQIVDCAFHVAHIRLERIGTQGIQYQIVGVKNFRETKMEDEEEQYREWKREQRRERKMEWEREKNNDKDQGGEQEEEQGDERDKERDKEQTKNKQRTSKERDE